LLEGKSPPVHVARNILLSSELRGFVPSRE